MVFGEGDEWQHFTHLSGRKEHSTQVKLKQTSPENQNIQFVDSMSRGRCHFEVVIPGQCCQPQIFSVIDYKGQILHSGVENG